MKSVLKYNQLGSEIRTRDEIQSLIELAKSEEQNQIVKKLSELLKKNPEDDKFDIDVQNLAVEQVPFSFLGGVDFENPDSEDIAGMGKPVPVADIYKMITKKVIEMMKEATGKDYKKKWKASENISGFMIPFNFDTKKQYRGINVFLLKSKIGYFSPFKNPYFLTFKQVEKHKGKVKKGAKGYEVVYFTKLYRFEEYSENGKTIIKSFATYDIKKMKAYIKQNFHLLPDYLKIAKDPYDYIPILKYYNVFNGEDIEGIDFKLNEIKIGRCIPEDSKENLPANLIVENYPNPPMIIHGGDKAFYMPSKDFVQVPKATDFETNNDYYRTLFHELTHSTGNEKRLDRDMTGRFGSKNYAKEELVAEFGAVFLSAQAGIVWYQNRNHAEYIKNWHNVIKIAESDTRFLMRSASQAQKATDFILNLDANGEPKFWKEILKVVKKTKKEPKKEEKPKKTEHKSEEEYPFSIDDIDYNIAYDAFRGTSFSPEERAKSSREEYFSTLKEIYDKNKAKAIELNKLDEFESKFERFKNGYHKRYLAWLNSRRGLISTMIAGGANFPVRRMEKKNETIHKRLGELIDFTEKYENFFKNKITKKIIKTGSSTAIQELEEKLAELEKERELGKIFNKAIRAYKKTLNEADFFKVMESSDIDSSKLIDYFKEEVKKGFATEIPTYANANISQYIRKIKQQIELEKRLAKTFNDKGNTEIPTNEGTIILNREINKVQILFNDKPEKEIREFIKKAGYAFKWSPKNGVWQRQLNTFSNLKGLKEFLGAKEEPPKETEKPKAPKKPKTKEKPKTIKDKVLLYQDELKKLETHTDLRNWAIKNNLDNASAFSKFKKALLEIGINYDALRQKKFSKEKENLKSKITHSIDLYSDYKLGTNKFAITTANGDPLWYGIDFEKPASQAQGELNAANKAVWFANKVKEVMGFDALKLNLYVDAEYLVYNSNPKQKGYSIIRKSNQYNLDTKVRWIPGKENPADEYTTARGYKNWRENDDFSILVDEIKPKNKNSKVDEKGQLALFGVKKKKKKGLNAPNDIPKTSEKNVHSNIRSINDIGHNGSSFFKVNGEVGKFLQAVERKPVHSVVITLDGEQGAGKTTTLYHFMDAFASAGNRSLFISGEEHQDSALAIEKRDKYLSEEAQKNISIVSEVESVAQLYDYIDPFDIIFIDSWQKLLRMVGNIRLDEDLRKKFNGKVFVVIFQQTTTGRTKGGAEVVFDGDIIIKMVKQNSFSENYAYFDKNRYTKIPLENLRYNIASGFTYNPLENEESLTDKVKEEEITVKVY